MDDLSEATRPRSPGRGIGSRLWPWLLGVSVFVVYAGNLRVVTPGDNIPAALFPLALVRGDGVYLDRFDSQVRSPTGDHALHYYVVENHGHLLSAYPLGAGMVATPLMAPAIVVLDVLDPGWDRQPGAMMGVSLWLAKFASAAIGALIAVVLYYLLCAVGLHRVATITVLAAALGSNLWMIAGQTLWQHGPAALMLVLSALLLSAPQRSPRRLLLAGFTTSLLVWCRPPMMIFAIAIFGWVVWSERRRVAWFASPCVLMAALLLAYNVWFFGTLLGGNARLETTDLHRQQHAVGSAWTDAPLEGLLGTLISPSHGLLIFTPWVGLAVGLLPVTCGGLPKGSIMRWLFGALAPITAMNFLYAPWWAGHSFGPRYWTEAMPLFAVMLGLALEWSRRRRRGWSLALAGTILFAIAVQTIGAVCHPSSWSTTPRDVDLHHERLWDWRDSELTRCLREGPAPRWSIRF